jgi:hypothetical protein
VPGSGPKGIRRSERLRNEKNEPDLQKKRYHQNAQAGQGSQAENASREGAR